MLNTFSGVLVGAIVVSSSAAAQQCANRGTTIEIVDCHEARYEAADRELNSVYNEAMRSLSGDARDKLREAQRAWLRFRDASFEFVIEANKDRGTFANVLIGDYKATLVEKRVRELKHVTSSPADPPVVW